MLSAVNGHQMRTVTGAIDHHKRNGQMPRHAEGEAESDEAVLATCETHAVVASGAGGIDGEVITLDQAHVVDNQCKFAAQGISNRDHLWATDSTDFVNTE